MARVRSGEELRSYRESYDYRREYFKKNPGLFGCIWFCSQCYKPLFGRSNVYVDHIIPLAQGGKNHVSNCTAICRSCNLKKSDKVDGRIVKGYIFRFFESNLFRTQRGAGAAAALGVGLAAGAVSSTATVATKVGKTVLSRGFKTGKKVLKSAIKAVTFPLRKGTFVSRLMFLAIYTLIVLYLLSRYTTLLDAWI